MVEKLTHCSFCSKHKNEVKKLIVGHQVAICNDCVNLCSGLLSEKKADSKEITLNSLDPRAIRDHLDEYVIGQHRAKIVLAVAIANHYKRINAENSSVEKSNILMIGPTGTGKTLLAKTVAQYLDVPFVIADATTLTEAGYVGDDVESLIQRLYMAADCDVERTQRGIVFLDEVDKISRKSESSTVNKDVSGEGVQQALLKLVEGTVCRITPPGGRKSSDTIDIDTKNILFVAGGAFVDLEKIIKQRDRGTAMGFGAEVSSDSSVSLQDVTPDDIIRYGMIPEFIGRFSSVVSLDPLSKQDLVSILTLVKNNYVEQYQWLFEQDGIELAFEPESIELIAEQTMKTKSGARGLHSELERILLPHMFDLVGYKRQNILKLAINKDLVAKPQTLLQENE
jgi:ATP-dependent Clp protease ATP-binding subunit ClpX